MTQPDDDALRVSDAERDAVLRMLGDHAAVGRLTLDELEDRSGRALTAKTRGELATLTSDLPREAGQPGAQSPVPAGKKPVRWMVAIMGGSNIYVPDSVDVEVGGFSIMGGHEEVGSERTPRPGAPVIRIRVYTLMGGASIYRLPPQARGVSLKDARRLAKAAERGELPAPD